MESSERESTIKKALSNRSARSLSVVALLALVPVVLFAVGRSVLAVVAAVNVALIFGSLYLLTSPAEDEEHGSEDHESTEAATEDEAPESTV